MPPGRKKDRARIFGIDPIIGAAPTTVRDPTLVDRFVPASLATDRTSGIVGPRRAVHRWTGPPRAVRPWIGPRRAVRPWTDDRPPEGTTGFHRTEAGDPPVAPRGRDRPDRLARTAIEVSAGDLQARRRDGAGDRRRRRLRPTKREDLRRSSSRPSGVTSTRSGTDSPNGLSSSTGRSSP